MTPKEKDLRLTQLRREHEIIWTFETIGARSKTLRKLAENSAATHRASRDRIRALLIDADQEPPTPDPGYESRALVDTEAMQLRAQELLAQLIQVQLELIPVGTHTVRAQAIEALSELAISSVAWGAPAQAFPGLD
ncbi:MAG: DUF4439 domain-containing protein [Actinomycetales bacterium]|nr:DUF4439 domain-containing protein [Actinomycetales bacterium]